MKKYPPLGHDDPTPILRIGEGVYSVLTPIGWRHLMIGKTPFDREHFLIRIERRGW